MPYIGAKIYSDGSHYIAIPYHPKPFRRRKPIRLSDSSEEHPVGGKPDIKVPKVETDEIGAEEKEREKRNRIERRVRLSRKVHLNEWSYFCTFTYDDKLHTEETFRKKLSECLRRLSTRKGWRYIGVWERSPEKQRLHFHGLFYIPKEGMIGELHETTDYNTEDRCRQTILQNSHFKQAFGRNDFKEVCRQELDSCMHYIMKYLGKTGEKLVYSRNVPTYVISDLLDEDVVCKCGIEERKLLLVDDFACWDEGEYLGKMSPEVKNKMRKSY